MWQIKEEFKDNRHPIGKSWVYLNADKPINPWHISYPITWSGFVDGNKVKIIQKGQLAYSVDDFEFEEFPKIYEYIKGRIVKWINDYLRILD